MNAPAEPAAERTPACYSPAGAAASAAAYLSAALLFSDWRKLLAATLIVLAAQSVRLRRFEPALLAAKVTLPLAVPLLLVHGILNPHFPAERLLWEVLPWRGAGFAYAATVGARLALVAAAMTIWRFTRSAEVIGFCHRIGVPAPVTSFVAIATASFELVQQKARSVQLAQQARGTDLRASLGARIAGLTKLVIPVAVAMIVEGHERGGVLENRGLGSGPWNLRRWYVPPRTPTLVLEWLLALAVFLPRFLPA